MNRIVQTFFVLMLMCLSMPAFAGEQAGGYMITIVHEGHSIASMELPPDSQISVQADHMDMTSERPFNGNVRLEFGVGKYRGLLKADTINITPLPPLSGETVHK